MPIWQKIHFQNRNSPLIEHLNFLHDHNMIISTIITIIVLYSILKNFKTKLFNRFFVENQEIEYIWTSIPAFILIILAIPSIKILYITEEYSSPSITIKTTGHQWYWSYEYSNKKNLYFDSFITEEKSIRLIRTSNNLIIPNSTTIRMLITSDDVIHSWTIPSIGIKVDAVPGRINQLIIFSDRVGIFTGQCREICGANHRFIPITISSISMNKFINSIINIYIKWPSLGNGLLSHNTAIAFNESLKFLQ